MGSVEAIARAALSAFWFNAGNKYVVPLRGGRSVRLHFVFDRIHSFMYTVLQTEAFVSWHSGLRNIQAKLAVVRRIDRVSAGNLGDVKSVGGGISEMRLNIGSGYRIYLTFRERVCIVLLVGGDKASQSADIRQARMLAKRLEHE
ncbi:putative addiction module killer protein [Pseudomonas sp. NFACC02]|nr:putative addiction module killer protein [Pseudomonas sp. NFACC02]